MTKKLTSIVVPPDGAKDFLLQEYQSLNALYHANRSANESRLNFYVTIVTTIVTITVTTQSLIAAEVRLWSIAGLALMVGFMGTITFQAMVKNRNNTGVLRRRIKRVRAWFLKHYPMSGPGLPYDIVQNEPISHGDNRLGSNESIVAFINTVIFAAAILSLTSALGLGISGSSLLASGVIGVASWFWHLYHKNKAIEKAETDDKKEIQRLDDIK